MNIIDNYLNIIQYKKSTKIKFSAFYFSIISTISASTKSFKIFLIIEFDFTCSIISSFALISCWCKVCKFISIWVASGSSITHFSPESLVISEIKSVNISLGSLKPPAGICTLIYLLSSSNSTSLAFLSKILPKFGLDDFIV